MTLRIPKHRLFVLTALAIVGSGIAAINGGVYRDGRLTLPWANPGPPAGLLVAPDHLNFGEAWEQDLFVWVFPVENSLDQDVVIDSFSTSCSCTAVEPPSLTIPAGAKRDLRLVLNLVANTRKPSDSESAPFDVTIRPIARCGGTAQPPVSWNVRGRVRSVVSLDRSSVDLGRHSCLSQESIKQVICIKSFPNLQKLLVDGDSPTLKVEVHPVESNPREFRLSISPAGTKVGSLDSRLHVTTVLMDGTRLTGKSLVVTGSIVEDIQVSPPEISFAAVKVGTQLEETITIYSLTQRVLKVTGFSSESDNIRVEAKQGEKFEAPAVSVRVRVEKQGQSRERVNLHVKAAEEETTISVPVSYWGLNDLDD